MAKSHKSCMEQAEIIDTFGTYHQARVKLILSLSTLSTHAMNERKKDSWHFNGKEKNDGEGSDLSLGERSGKNSQEYLRDLRFGARESEREHLCSYE